MTRIVVLIARFGKPCARESVSEQGERPLSVLHLLLVPCPRLSPPLLQVFLRPLQVLLWHPLLSLLWPLQLSPLCHQSLPLPRPCLHPSWLPSFPSSAVS